VSEWKHIDTAPKDGTRVILWLPVENIAVSGFYEWMDGESCDGYEMYPGYFDWFIDNDLILFEDEHRPTHWMEFPKIPKETP